MSITDDFARMIEARTEKKVTASIEAKVDKQGERFAFYEDIVSLMWGGAMVVTGHWYGAIYILLPVSRVIGDYLKNRPERVTMSQVPPVPSDTIKVYDESTEDKNLHENDDID